MNNIWSGLSIGLFVGAVATRYYYGSSPLNSDQPSTKPFEKWSLMEKADFVVRFLKFPLKIATKSLREWKASPTPSLKASKRKEPRSWISYATGPNALTVYTLLVGVAFMSYAKTKQQDLPGDASLATRTTTLLDTGMNSARKIMSCYTFINSTVRFAQKPSSYAVPMVFAAAMVGFNCWRNG